MQPFCIDLSINLLLCIRWACRCLETKLKSSLPSTFKRATGRKSDSLFSEGLRKKFRKEICLLWDIFCKPYKVYHLDQVQRHFYVKTRFQKKSSKEKLLLNFFKSRGSGGRSSKLPNGMS